MSEKTALLAEKRGKDAVRHDEKPKGTWIYRVLAAVFLLCCVAFRHSEIRDAFEQLRGSHHASFDHRARKILQKHPLIDGHNDLAIFVRAKYKNHIYDNEFQAKFENGGLAQHVDIPRLKTGLQGGAFWSAFWPCPAGNGTDFSDQRYHDIVQSTLGQLDLLGRLAQQYPKYFSVSETSTEARKAFHEGHLISPLAIEGLHQIGNSVANLRLFHQLGVRYATLTWNCHNKYADAAIETGEGFKMSIAKPYWNGLSPAGRDLVKEMNRLGMLVDLAHVSEDTMRDVLVGIPGSNNEGEEAEGWHGSLAPPIFSHSSAYSICPHPRNVADDILHLVKKRNSVVMVNFNPDFIACVHGKTDNDLPTTVPENATLLQVVKHIRHIGELVGYDHVGIGSDYDGIEETPKGLEDVTKFPDLVAELLRQGVSEKDVVKIIGGNVLRVWEEADKVSAKLKKTMLPLEDDFGNGWATEKEEL